MTASRSLTRRSPGATEDAPRQTLRLVLKAEWCSLWARGGVRIGAIIAAAAAVVIGSLVFVVLHAIAQEPSYVVSSTPIEAASATFGVVFGLVVAIAVGRDAEGRLSFTMLRTPRRSRLFAARAVSLLSMGMLGALACSAVVAAISLLFALPGSATAVPLAGMALLTHTLAIGLMALLSFGLSTIARRSVPAVLTYLSLSLLLPLTLAVVGVAVPGGLGSLISSASAWTPTHLLLQALSVSTTPTQGLSGVVGGLGGLLGWAVLTNLVARALFTRRDAA